jgi:hypothetical protein
MFRPPKCEKTIKSETKDTAEVPREYSGGLVYSRIRVNATRFPVRADCLAASRISVTITLFSSDDNPVDFLLPFATAEK